MSSGEEDGALQNAADLYKEALKLDTEKVHFDIKGKLGGVLRRLGKV